MNVITEDYLTVQQAAHEMSVTESAVHNATAEGRLSHTVVFGRKLISRADLDAYKQRTRPSGEKPRGRPRKAVEKGDFQPSRRA